MAYVSGISVQGCDDPRAVALTQFVFETCAAALAASDVTREDIDGVCIAASDQLDGRAISSMQLAGPAGSYLRDEIKVGDDGSLALASAAMRVDAGLSSCVLVASWTKPDESPPAAADAVNPEPVFARPAGLHPLAAEAALTSSFLDRHDLAPEDFDALADALGGGKPGDDVIAWPLARGHLPPPTPGAVAMVVTKDPTDVEIAAVEWASEHAHPPSRAATPEERLADLARQVREAAELDDLSGAPIETTDRTVYRLAMAAAGLGLASAGDAPRVLAAGDLPFVNPSGGLWASNPPFAAGLERVAHAADHVRNGGASAALAHSTYGFAGQGQMLTVLRRAA